MLEASAQDSGPFLALTSFMKVTGEQCGQISLTCQLLHTSDMIQAMRTPRFTPIETLPLVGGRTCLDFVNTTGLRASSSPRERLRTYADLLVFGRRAGILPAARAKELGQQADARPRDAARALARMLALREALYRLFRAVERGRAPDPADLAQLGKDHAEASCCRRLVWRDGGAAWLSEIPRDDLLVLCGPLVGSAVELLTSAEAANLRKCGECEWLFLDTSRNGGRRWCKKTCGDRVKSRAYYRRRRAARKG